MSASSRLTTSQVAHIAKLAHVDVSEEEIEVYTKQLAAITDYIAQLDEVDVSQVPPTFQVIDGTHNIWRDDEIKPGLSQAEALSQAKRTHRGFFVVKALIKEPK